MSRVDGISPSDMSIIASVAEYTETTYRLDDDGAIAIQKGSVVLYDFDHAGRVALPTGFVPALVDRAKQARKVVNVTDHRTFSQRHETSAAVVAKATKEDRELLKLIAANPLGQIETQSMSQTIQRMALICQVFPDARVLIVVSRRKLGQLLRRKLNEMHRHLRLHLKPAGKPWSPHPAQRTVTTYQSLTTCDATEWDIVLLPDAADATKDGFSGLMGVLAYRPHRCYSFPIAGRHRSRRDSVRLEAMSGSMIHAIAKKKPAIEVLWLQSPRSKKSNLKTRTLDWKRAAYWRNELRNDFVAGVARAFAELNHKKLQKYGVPFRDGEPQFINNAAPAVTILVESVEHKHELEKRLPGWIIKDEVQAQSDDETPQHRIITTVCAAYEGIECDVLIRATGCSGVGAFSNTVAEFDASTGQLPALIIDFDDNNDELTVMDARSRRREYVRLNWQQLPSTSSKAANREDRLTPALSRSLENIR